MLSIQIVDISFFNWVTNSSQHSWRGLTFNSCKLRRNSEDCWLSKIAATLLGKISIKLLLFSIVSSLGACLPVLNKIKNKTV